VTAAPTQATHDGDAGRKERLRALAAATNAKLAELDRSLAATHIRSKRVNGLAALQLATSRECVTASLALLARCRV
jgi:hypothetical protein